jgi:allantoin racemase
MKIKVVNPVATDVWDQQQLRLLNLFKDSDTKIEWVNVKKGVTEIEQYYDEAFAIGPAVEEMVQAEKEAFDAVLMPCFGDVGLDAAKEALSIPVVGACEASVHLASMLGRKFSILATTKKAAKSLGDLVCKYGLTPKLASIKTVGLSPLEFSREKERLKEALLKNAKEAVEKDGADAIVLGCGGMAVASWLQEQIGVPVVEPMIAGLKIAETFVKMQLAQSKQAFVKP